MLIRQLAAGSRVRWRVSSLPNGAVAVLLVMLPWQVSTDKASEKLDEFCNRNMAAKHGESKLVVDCSCCATSHLSGDYSAQVALQYGGDLTDATALNDDVEVGKVPMWSLSDFVPQVTCVDGNKLVCTCQGEGTKIIEESMCITGPVCSKREEPTEWPPGQATDVQEAQKDAAKSEDMSNAPNDNIKNPADDDEPRSCTSMGKSASASIPRRVSLGSARCEDASPKQCHLFYSKVDDRWHHCQAKVEPKKCHAMLQSEEKLRERAKLMEDWGIMNAFSPGAWPVTIKADGTVGFDENQKPTMQEFATQVDNLPPRISESFRI